MNTISANELKRHGIAAIERLIINGPVHVVKRNRPVCVVLSESEYESLIQTVEGEAASRKLSVMEWFSLPPLACEEKSKLDDRLFHERKGWEHG